MLEHINLASISDPGQLHLQPKKSGHTKNPTQLIYNDISHIMVTLGAKIFRGRKEQEAYDRTFAGKYQKMLKKNHFLFFGLPFMLSIVAGSIYLQKFTAVKWEQYDEKYHQLGEEEMLSLIENKRPVDKKNDYYRLQGLLTDHLEKEVHEEYEIVRVARKKEDEPVWSKQQ